MSLDHGLPGSTLGSKAVASKAAASRVSRFELPISPGRTQRLAAGWLILGIFALAASGIYSILIVLSRTPLLHAFIPWTDFFHTALVVHVDLSVLIWFLALAGVIWTLCSSTKAYVFGQFALLLTALGTLLIALAPFTGEGNPLMNNYIPILQNSVFYTGLILVGFGFALLVLRSLFWFILSGVNDGASSMRLGAYAAVVTAGLALLALLWSWLQLRQLPVTMMPYGRAYYELLFWGGGHLLQITHTVLLLLVWLWLALSGKTVDRLSPVLIATCFGIAAIPALAAVLIYINNDIMSAQHRIGFTVLMQYGGLASLPLGLIVLWSVFRTGPSQTEEIENRPIQFALLASMSLFAMGGVLAFMIDGINVVIPAHYHGSIVGVTLAFMGLTYYLLPRLGFRPISSNLASWQPWVYGGGQTMHILGLAWSGGYGVQRKTAGAAQGLDSLPEIAGMAMMGLGGLIAIIGGILFVVVAIRSMWP